MTAVAIEIHEQPEIVTFYLDDRDKRMLQVEPWGARRRRYSAQSWLNVASAREALADGSVEWEDWTFGVQTSAQPGTMPRSLVAQRRATSAGVDRAEAVRHRPITVPPKP